MDIPTWLEEGPGKKLHKDTKSIYVFSSNHFFCFTKTFLKYPIWAIGPPKDVNPNKKKDIKISKLLTLILFFIFNKYILNFQDNIIK